MERILYFDCFAGISGDMSIAALIDLGLNPEAVIKEIAKLGVKGYQIEIKKVNRFSISGTDVTVRLNGEAECVHDHGDIPCNGHNHDHSHNHSRDENGKHQNSHDHSHGHGHSDHADCDLEHSHGHDNRERSLGDISHIIQSSEISQRAKEIAIAVFTEIAKAEAAVHGKTVEEVHFHEVGAIDSIVDIVGAAICIDMLQVDKIYCSPVHEGQGFIHCRHGRLPVPVPAVIKMLGGSGISIVTEDIQAELVTPTGFGILKTITEGCGKMPEMLVESVGYGFGKTDTGRLNALRAILGTRSIEKDGKLRDQVILMETNIDNTSGEALGYTAERLLNAGALDAYFTPIQMKKNRPATMLSVICKKEDSEKLSELIFKETATIGIRIRETERITLDRKISTVQTELGEVRVKLVSVSGLERVQPEYEDCAKIAAEKNLSLNEVYEIVKMKFMK
ncbi:nickel pincer cofactor biosynthesis protein LarC [Anoxybacterium hadale]|uniref:Nickel pincer cofactor biosynthesis protein LarC n=1 Tax=Anoxybacterium hadale TaxID=3408580 RepID=A0ACD1AAQ4_9FIRM|nr:nickel pincer cofactor biosynthesis protein LarC [Clostridiales bacterium]